MTIFFSSWATPRLTLFSPASLHRSPAFYFFFCPSGARARARRGRERSMDQRLSNAFSVLSLDADDTLPASSSSVLKPLPSNGNDEKGSKVSPEGNGKVERVYRMPLVWIDMEMTGLDVEVDRILEIACIITDGSLNKMVEGPDLVISQSKECMDRMGEWCQTHHGASGNVRLADSVLIITVNSDSFCYYLGLKVKVALGLTKKVLESKVSEKEAENQVIEFVKRHVGSYTPLLAGNTVYMDFLFLKKYMPDLASLFSHNVVDVSSVKQLCIRWYPKDYKKAPEKTNKHRALDDIRESIMELKFYKQNIFKAKSK